MSFGGLLEAEVKGELRLGQQSLSLWEVQKKEGCLVSCETYLSLAQELGVAYTTEQK